MQPGEHLQRSVAQEELKKLNCFFLDSAKEFNLLNCFKRKGAFGRIRTGLLPQV